GTIWGGETVWIFAAAVPWRIGRRGPKTLQENGPGGFWFRTNSPAIAEAIFSRSANSHSRDLPHSRPCSALLMRQTIPFRCPDLPPDCDGPDRRGRGASLDRARWRQRASAVAG